MLDNRVRRGAKPPTLMSGTSIPLASMSPASIGLVAAQLASLAAGLRAGDRADPRHETVLCLVESAWLAAEALHRDGRARRSLAEALAAARAAVTAASFALVEHGPYGLRR